MFDDDIQPGKRMKCPSERRRAGVTEGIPLWDASCKVQRAFLCRNLYFGLIATVCCLSHGFDFLSSYIVHWLWAFSRFCISPIFAHPLAQFNSFHIKFRLFGQLISRSRLHPLLAPLLRRCSCGKQAVMCIKDGLLSFHFTMCPTMT